MFKCGNTGKEFGTRQAWLKHLCDMGSPIMDGEQRDIGFCKKYLEKKVENDKNDEKSKKLLRQMNMED